MGLTQITTGGVDENINIDSNTLKVDGNNNRVGIGTGSPTSKLTVAETGYSAVEIRSNRTSAADNIGAIHFRTVSTDVAYIQSLVDGTLKFRNTSALTERMRIDTSGRVLIGETAAATANSFLTVKNGSGDCEVNVMSGPTSSSVINLGDTGDYNIGRIQYDQSTNSLRFDTSNTERLRIDSSGNVGIGNSSPTNSNGYNTLTIGNGTSTGGQIHLENSSGANFYLWHDSQGANIYNQSASSQIFYTNATERMRLDGSGRLLVGTSSSSADCSAVFEGSSSSAAAIVHLSRSTGVNNSSTLGALSFGDNAQNRYAQIKAAADHTPSGSSYPGRLLFLTTANGSTSLTERMRIDSSGVVNINQSAYNTFRLQNPTSNGANMLIQNSTTGLGTGNGLFFGLGDNEFTYLWNYHNEPIILATNNAERMRITSDGKAIFGGTTSTAAKWNFWDTNSTGMAWLYNTSSGNYRRAYLWGSSGSMGLYFHNGINEGALTPAGAWSNASDARIKKDIEPISYGLAEVMASQPRKYKMRSNDEDCIGFVAQEMREIVPEVVSGGETEDRMYGLDYGSLVAVAFKAIQEQQATIVALQNRVAALEAAE